jgi:hypothetical protein
LARLDESIAAFKQRFIFPLAFAMKIIKINLWNQGRTINDILPNLFDEDAIIPFLND